ncbi:4-phosphoerythronate dehydrogenase [bacterium]|nr:4-phosphoerythronate dehydrogenase [bacterium]
MNFLIDKGILYADEAFSTIGDVCLQTGESIARESVKNIDVLVLRTTTKVNRDLLEGSRVKYVATATSGSDHVDKKYLKAKGIGFAAAPGCNAEAVAEFVINALLRLSNRNGFDLDNKTLGIIGAGHAGSALERKAGLLGLKCLLNDPPLFEQTKLNKYLPIQEVIRRSDIISLHVPLIKTGHHPTHYLINESTIELFKKGTILINTSRGGVVQESAICKNRSQIGPIITDVWENEPAISTTTLGFSDIATPHVAGYSLEGKIKATEMAYENVCHFFKLKPTWESPRKQADNKTRIRITGTGFKTALTQLMEKTYDIFYDDEALRKISCHKTPQEYFSSLRNHYAFRHEFSSIRVYFEKVLSSGNKNLVRSLGFIVE